MTWHIFKKDFRLLWHFAAGVAAIELLLTILIHQIDHGANNLRPFASLLGMLHILSSGVLAAMVVQLDALPGVRQDWLIRPISRWDLLRAKLLFVVMLVQGPIFACDLAGALVNGLPVGQAIGAALLRSIYYFFLLYVPVLALAAVTRSFAEGIVGAVAAVVLFGAVIQFMSVLNASHWRLFGIAGVDWIVQVGMMSVVALGVAAILGIQYFRRRTVTARWLTGCAGVVCLIVNFAPWQPLFAIQQRLSPDPGAASAVQLEFRPAFGRIREHGDVNMYYRAGRRHEDGTAVDLPIFASGLPPDSILRTDWAVARLIGPDGKVSDLGPIGTPQLNRNDPHAVNYSHSDIFVAAPLYQKLKSQPVRLELDYSLTLLRLASSHAMSATDGHQNLEALGRCETSLNSSATAVQLRCLKAGATPPFSTFSLEHPPSGAWNPPVVFCSGEYAPFFLQFTPDALTRTDANMAFRDAADLWHLPVSTPQLPESQVVIKLYHPVEHFTRHVVIPNVRLQDWLPLPRFTNPLG